MEIQRLLKLDTTDLTLPLWKRRLQLFMFFMNVLVAGYVAFPTLFAQNISNLIVWDNSATIGTAMSMTGSHWLAITLLSVLGLLYNPITFSVVFMHQLIYKTTFLVVHVLPNLAQGTNNQVPVGMSFFFLAWVILLPFAIPWNHYFKVIGSIRFVSYLSD